MYKKLYTYNLYYVISHSRPNFAGGLNAVKTRATMRTSHKNHEYNYLYITQSLLKFT